MYTRKTYDINSEDFNKIDILGEKYKIFLSDERSERRLINNDGFCDYSSKEIGISKVEEDEDTIKNIDAFYERVLIHEIIHSFMQESGLGSNCDWHCEEMVDWIAIQLPKINKTVQEAIMKFNVLREREENEKV